jgi:hypothetical protein
MDVHGFLGGLRGRLRRVLVLDGLARVVALGLGACAAAIAIDYCWPIPGPLRLVLLLGIAGVVAALINRRLVRPLGRIMDDRAMAQLAERRIPGLDGRLLTRVDGIELGAGDGQALAAALTPQAVVALVPAETMPRRLALATALLLALAGLGLAFPRFLHDGFNRLLFPLGATEWERHAVLEGGLERAVVAADEPLVVRISRAKGKEAPLRLSWVNEDGGTVERRMLSGLAGPWHQAVTLPAGSYRLIAESGDALPLVLHGRLVKRPVLAHVDATLTPPRYTQLPAQRMATLACTALPGSRLEFALDFALDSQREVTAAQVALGDTPLDTVRTATGLRGALTLAKGGVLAIQLKDQDGIGPSPEPRFTVVMAEDRRPVVALAGPRAKEAVTARAKVDVAVDASDDYGLAKLELLATVLAGEDPSTADHAKGLSTPSAAAKPGKTLATPFADVAGLAATTRKCVVAVADLAKEGERVVLVGRASDANDVSGPGVGESQPLELRVVSENELRQELDRLLGEARDRVVQAREEIAQGLAKPERLAVSSRGAALIAGKAGELLAQVVRRWRQNQLPPDQVEPAGKAEVLVNTQALARLAEAMKGLDPPARAADAHLAEAERLLAGMLQEGDLTRVLANLIEREKSLAAESRDFVKDYLTKPLDDAAKARRANLAQRQKELADQVKEVERRVLGSNSKQLEKAQELVRSEAPADQLQQASAKLGSDTQRAQAMPHQESAIKTLSAILDQLRGSDAATDLAKKAGELAARQERLAKQLDEGTEPKDLAGEQKKLGAETEQFGKQLDKQPAAAKAVAAGVEAQGDAAKAMDGGDRSGAAREASAAASLLREAQKQLGGQQEQEDKDKPKNKKAADVLALLKELHHQQAALVADSTPIFQRLGDKPLDFPAQRELPAQAERESDILLRLKEEGMKEVGQMPIVIAAMTRVAAALDKSAQHLAVPALGTHGMRLEKIALYELARLIDIAENLPPPDKPDDGGGKGGGDGNQAPFPPGAELALLAAMQEELAALTAAGRPVDLAGMQKEVDKLVELLANSSRPGSRPNLLLNRAHRAMASATDLLGGGDRGLTTRHEQAAAEASLRRLMAEAKAGKGGGKGGGKPPPQKPQNGNSPPPPADQPSSGGGASAGGNKSSQPAPNQPRDATVVAGAQERGEFLNLSPEKREQLKQAFNEGLSSEARQIYSRYLELMEENK